jgi:cytochrome P450
MVSLDPPAHARAAAHGARVHAAAGNRDDRDHPLHRRRPARRGRRERALRPRRDAHLPAAGDHRLLAHRRAARGLRDLTSALIDIHDEDPEAFTLDEIASILFSLSFAGHETTNYLIGNVVRRLLEDRARWERIVADPGAIPGAVEETLRFDPSVPVWRRVTTRPATVGGVDLPAGAKLFLWLAAAGRDASVFPEPDAFDLDRDNARRHLAFGRGIHYCLEATLGKLEAELALEELARRFPELALMDDRPLSFHPNISFRGPRELWVVAS